MCGGKIIERGPVGRSAKMQFGQMRGTVVARVQGQIKTRGAEISRKLLRRQLRRIIGHLGQLNRRTVDQLNLGQVTVEMARVVAAAAQENTGSDLPQCQLVIGNKAARAPPVAS